MAKIYTYKHDRIVSDYEFWTGHVDSYFNKCFIFKQIKPLIISVEDNISLIIDKCNDINVNIFKTLSRSEHLQSEFIKHCPFSDSVVDDNKLKEFLSESQVEAVHHVLDLIKLTKSTLYEFIDVYGKRNVLDVFNCQFKLFEEKVDVDNYLVKKKMVESFNLAVEKNMYDYLISLNAMEDFTSYHSSRSNMLKHISQTINNLNING